MLSLLEWGLYYVQRRSRCSRLRPCSLHRHQLGPPAASNRPPPRLPLPAPQVIKRTGVQMQQRQVQAAAIASWQNKVEKLEPQVGFQCFCMACMACKAKAQPVVPCSVEGRPG